MYKPLLLIIPAMLASACSTTLPRHTLQMDSLALESIDTSMLCKALLTPHMPEHLVYKTSVPGELQKRDMNKATCIDMLMVKHGEEAFCEGYNQAVYKGRNDAYISYFVDSTKLHRADLKEYFSLNNIDCGTRNYIIKKRHSKDQAANIRETSKSITKALLQATD